MTGILEVSADQYHADELSDRPTLSKSILKLLLDASPLHAKTAHPRLNPNWEPKEESKFDIGTAFHSLFLEGIDAAVICPFNDWRSAAAKEARAEARAHGKIPLLLKDYERVEQMVVSVRAQLNERDDGLFTAGNAEQTITWEDHGVICRARIDWLTNNQSEIHDIKTTKVDPEQWCRSTMFSIGADLQERLYCRGIEAITGNAPEFTFLLVEVDPPHAIKPVRMGPDVQTLADKKIDTALTLWKRCLDRDEWPGYDPRTAYADLPPWEESRWRERELREVAA